MKYRGHSIWERTATRPSFPALSGDLSVDVVVIGGGICGLTAALLLKEAGKSVAVLEMDRVASGATGHTTAHLTSSLDRSFSTLQSKFGRETLKRALEASAAAIDCIEATVQRHGIDCGFERVAGFKFTERIDDHPELFEEAEIARAFGLDASLSDGGSCRVFEGTRVQEVEDGSPCRVVTESGHTVRAGAVFHATHTPIGLVLSLHTRLGPYTSYVLAAPARGPSPNALFWDSEDPYHYVRRFVDAGEEFLIVGGKDHKTGQEEDSRDHFASLEEYARTRFAIGPVAHRWSWEVLEPADGLPYIGRMPATKNVFLATGFAGTGMTFGTVSGMVVSALMLGRSSPWEETFTPGRVKPLASAVEEVKENVNVAWRFVLDRLRGTDVEKIEEIPAGEGRLVQVDGQRSAVYRDVDGNVCVMSPVCTHAACIVQWNLAEKTWDCPCHGGRYHPDGRVLCGPPTGDLEVRVSEPT